eukprot:Plantae.Rhodophyta-Purpureofilum_apyrenoidigerum.ctg18875.p1 GENE.Plantae.Rhodophyta-Purpureofilum_apyrenoidigerum.ctg18875~~Plantae.Rhodophyta-Purpureofilum_apyrenoidigerum.ctg18875.p1  ORF type:complete len:260 (+),score=22.87 Plantae.Rhodophyta-Purpureofilum_apyrenoidigerum.ctg18875:150-929(+)
MGTRFVLVLDENGVGQLVPRKDIPEEVLRRLIEEGRAQEVTAPRRQEIFASYNIALTQNVPVVINRDGERELELARWGFVPSWWRKPGPPDFATHNARDDKLRSSSVWKGALDQQRCMIPVTGFYEWEKRGNEKLPYFIHRKDKQLMAFAGLYSQFTDTESGQKASSFTIITTPTNELMEPLHPRIPLILGGVEDELWSVWLDPKTKFDQVEQHVRSREWPEMTMHRVSTAVNPSHGQNYANRPELIDPVEDVGQPVLF